MANQHTPLVDRFNAAWMPEPNSGCWLWTGACSVSRNGDVRPQIVEDGRAEISYRTSWRMHRGPIPAGKMICHKCDVSICVNPDHLYIGTAGTNARDCVTRGRKYVARGEKHSSAKLSAEQVRAIRASTGKMSDIARRFGVVPSTVSMIKSGATWKGETP